MQKHNSHTDHEMVQLLHAWRTTADRYSNSLMSHFLFGICLKYKCLLCHLWFWHTYKMTDMNWRRSMSELYVALNYGKMLQKLSNVWSSFWGAHNSKNTKFWSSFPGLKAVWHLLKVSIFSTAEVNINQVTEPLHKKQNHYPWSW
jgi:hypothetical protein